MDAALSFLIIFGLVFSLLWLSVYVYAFYSLGKNLAYRFRVKVSPAKALVIIGSLAIIVDIPFCFIPMHFLFKGTMLFALWLMHTQSTAVGYWAGYDIQRQRDLDRWRETTDKWIEGFEEQPAECMRGFESE